VLSRGDRQRIEPGRWKIVLTGRVINDGSFHAWIDLSKDFATPRFTKADNACTITIPGTSDKIITVGGFVTKFLPEERVRKGELAPGSSLGPTRATTGTRKPDITAPGFKIESAGRRVPPNVNYLIDNGTSFAAPHVAGAIALLLEKEPGLKQDEIKSILLTSTQPPDEFTGALPNDSWGHGKLDVPASLRSLTNLISERGKIMQSENLVTNQTPNGNLNLTSEAQTFTLQSERVLNGVSTPMSITISVQDGVVQSVQAQCDDGTAYSGELRFKLQRVPTAEEDGEECQCCSAGVNGLICVECPCQ
jgi:Subtilase family